MAPISNDHVPKTKQLVNYTFSQTAQVNPIRLGDFGVGPFACQSLAECFDLPKKTHPAESKLKLEQHCVAPPSSNRGWQKPPSFPVHLRGFQDRGTLKGTELGNFSRG